MSFIPSFSDFKTYSGYLFFGCCLVIIFLDLFEPILNDSDFTTIITTVILVGGVLGGILSSIRIHKLFRITYWHLHQFLDNDFVKFRSLKHSHYLQWFFTLGLTFLGISSLIYENVRNNFFRIMDSIVKKNPYDIIALSFWILFLISWLILYLQYRFNAEILLLIRHVELTSKSNNGIERTHEAIQKLNDLLEKGYWRESKKQMDFVINRCNKIIIAHENPDYRTRNNPKYPHKLGLRHLATDNLDVKNLEEVINGLINRDLPSQDLPNTQSIGSGISPMPGNLHEKFKELKLSWKIRNYDLFLLTSFPWIIRMEIKLIHFLNSIRPSFLKRRN